jgi:hypothetical protein
MTREEMQARLLQVYGVDTLPVPELGTGFADAVAARLPANFDLRAKCTTVILKLQLSDEGRVLAVDTDSAPNAVRRRVISVCFDGWRPRVSLGSSSVVAPDILQSAIQAEVRNLTFKPAMRNGLPVPIERFEFGMEFRREQLLRSAI